MGLRQILMPVRAWWFLRIARNATIPADVGRYLVDLRDRNQLSLEEIERKRQTIIDEGAAEGKSISTEAALKSVLKLRETYDGPDRDKYVSDLDQFIDNFRKSHGVQIPVDDAYAILKDLEARLGRVE
jgi:nucleoside-triphosphatase THEP1